MIKCLNLRSVLPIKKALVALDPTSCDGINFDHFVEVIRFFQSKRVIPAASIASVFHRGLTPFPLEVYRSQKRRLIKEAESKILKAAHGRFDFDFLQMLESPNSSSECHTLQLSNHAKKIGADLIVVGSNDRTGIPLWFLGSFSETAALTSDTSVLVIKPEASALRFSRIPVFVLCVDVSAPPSDKIIVRINKLALAAGATLALHYVIPRRIPLVDRLQMRKEPAQAKKVLTQLKRKFESRGTKTTISIAKENISIAHTVVNFAEKKKAFLTITVAAKRSRMRRLMLGSHARRILGISNRPFLSIRPQ